MICHIFTRKYFKHRRKGHRKCCGRTISRVRLLFLGELLFFLAMNTVESLNENAKTSGVRSFLSKYSFFQFLEVLYSSFRLARSSKSPSNFCTSFGLRYQFWRKPNKSSNAHVPKNLVTDPAINVAVSDQAASSDELTDDVSASCTNVRVRDLDTLQRRSTEL